MSERKWTPGPWDFPLYALSDDDLKKARSVGIEPSRFLANDGSVVIMSGIADDDTRKSVANVACRTRYKRGEGYRTQCDERDANARLIAAAPELYEALEWVLDGLGALSNRSELDAILGEDSTLVYAARAKARGDA